MAELRLHSPIGELQIIDEPTYSFNSTGNIRRYRHEFDLWEQLSRRGAHGVLLDGQAFAVVGCPRWMMPVSAHSAVVWHDRLFMILTDTVVCFSLAPFGLIGAVVADMACCFGLHLSLAHDTLICHGEFDITRLSPDACIAWQQSGRDIFTGGFTSGPTRSNPSTLTTISIASPMIPACCLQALLPEATGYFTIPVSCPY